MMPVATSYSLQMCIGRKLLGECRTAIALMCVWSHTPTREVLGNAVIHLYVCGATPPLGKAWGML